MARLPTAKPLEPFQHPQSFRRGERVKGQIQGALEVGLERIEDLDDLFPTTERMFEL